MSTQEKPSIATEIFTTLRREILSGKFARNDRHPIRNDSRNAPITTPGDIKRTTALVSN